MSWALLNSECLQPIGDVGSMRGGGNVPIDRKNPAVPADEERPPLCETRRAEHPVRPRRRLPRIAQDRKIQSERCRESGVGVRIIDAGCKVLDVETPQRVAARPERPALGRSPSCEGLREPGQHDRASPDEVGEAVRATVRARKRKIGRAIARLEHGHGLTRAEHLVGQAGRNGNHCRGERSQH
jgi:hypothetical protein